MDPYSKDQILSFYNFHLKKFGDRPEALAQLVRLVGGQRLELLGKIDSLLGSLFEIFLDGRHRLLGEPERRDQRRDAATGCESSCIADPGEPDDAARGRRPMPLRQRRLARFPLDRCSALIFISV